MNNSSFVGVEMCIQWNQETFKMLLLESTRGFSKTAFLSATGKAKLARTSAASGQLSSGANHRLARGLLLSMADR